MIASQGAIAKSHSALAAHSLDSQSSSILILSLHYMFGGLSQACSRNTKDFNENLKSRPSYVFSAFSYSYICSRRGRLRAQSFVRQES